jgi:hypothetical protein
MTSRLQSRALFGRKLRLGLTKVFQGVGVPKKTFKFGAGDQGGADFRAFVNEVPDFINAGLTTNFASTLEMLSQSIDFELPSLTTLFPPSVGWDFIVSGGDPSVLAPIADVMVLKRIDVGFPVRVDVGGMLFEGRFSIGADNVRVLSGVERVGTRFKIGMPPNTPYRNGVIDRLNIGSESYFDLIQRRWGYNHEIWVERRW